MIFLFFYLSSATRVEVRMISGNVVLDKDFRPTQNFRDVKAEILKEQAIEAKLFEGNSTVDLNTEVGLEKRSLAMIVEKFIKVALFLVFRKNQSYNKYFCGFL